MHYSKRRNGVLYVLLLFFECDQSLVIQADDLVCVASLSFYAEGSFLSCFRRCPYQAYRPLDFPCWLRGVAIFAKACFGHPSPSKRQKLNATANAFGAPIRPRHLVPTPQGVGTLAPNDLTPYRMAFYFGFCRKSR